MGQVVGLKSAILKGFPGCKDFGVDMCSTAGVVTGENTYRKRVNVCAVIESSLGLD